MIDKRKVLRGFNLISKNKVVISKTASEHAGQKDSFGKKKVLSKIEIMPQNSVCSETYLVVFASDNDEEVQNVKNYLSTKFVRFLLSCVASTQNLTKESFMFVPVQDFSKSFSDQELFRKYDLSQEEISFIENMIKPMA
jgi:site-specific DNA-methyltransferase (adenine-specific)